MSPALAGRFLTTAPPGESRHLFKSHAVCQQIRTRRAGRKRGEHGTPREGSRPARVEEEQEMAREVWGSRPRG